LLWEGHCKHNHSNHQKHQDYDWNYQINYHPLEYLLLTVGAELGWLGVAVKRNNLFAQVLHANTTTAPEILATSSCNAGVVRVFWAVFVVAFNIKRLRVNFFCRIWVGLLFIFGISVWISSSGRWLRIWGLVSFVLVYDNNWLRYFFLVLVCFLKF
jgi:hypothetical protein